MIYSVPYLLVVQIGLDVKRPDLSCSVHSGIRAAGHVQPDRSPEYRRQDAFYLSLYCSVRGLQLRTVQVCSVIFNYESDSHFDYEPRDD